MWVEKNIMVNSVPSEGHVRIVATIDLYPRGGRAEYISPCQLTAGPRGNGAKEYKGITRRRRGRGEENAIEYKRPISAN